MKENTLTLKKKRAITSKFLILFHDLEVIPIHLKSLYFTNQLNRIDTPNPAILVPQYNK